MSDDYLGSTKKKKLSLSVPVMKARMGIVIKNFKKKKKMVILHSIFQRGKY